MYRNDGCIRVVLVSILFYVALSEHVSIEDNMKELIVNKMENDYFNAIPVVHYNSFIEVEDGSCLIMTNTNKNEMQDKSLSTELLDSKKKKKKKKSKSKRRKKRRKKSRKHKKSRKGKKGSKGSKGKKHKKRCTKNKPQCKPNFHCPIPGGVCCSGGSFCCPQGSKCSGNGRCQQTGIQRAMAIARMKMEEEGRKQLKKKAKKASSTEGGQKRIQEMKAKSTKEKSMKERLKKKAAAVAMKAQKAKKKRLQKRKQENHEKKSRMKLRMKKEKAEKTASKNKMERRKKHERSKKHAKNTIEKKQKSDKKARQREHQRQKERKRKNSERSKKERASKRVTWKTVTSRVIHSKEGKSYSVAKSSSTSFTYSFWLRIEGKTSTKCNILRHGSESTSDQSSPSVGMSKSSSKLHIVSSVKGDKKFGGQTSSLPMFKWVHVVILHKPGRFVVSINGKNVIDRFSPPPIKANGKLWLSAGGMKACAVSTADIKFAPKWVSSNVLNKYRKSFLKRADKLPGFKDKTKVIAINVDKDGLEPKRGKKLNNVDLPRSYAYTIMMWIKQSSIQPGWSSIFQRGQKNLERAPAIYAHPSNTGIHMCVTATKPNNCINSPPLKLGEWHHIAFSVESGRMVGYADGVKFASTNLQGTPKWVDGPTYVGSPHYAAFSGKVARIEFINKGPSFVKTAFIKRIFNKAQYPKAKIIDLLPAKKKAHEPKKSFVIKSASALIGKSTDYTAMMWIYIRGKNKRWTSVFHRGSTNHERLPAIFQSPGGTKLYLCSSTRKNWNNCVNTNSLQLNRWYHIAITASSSKMESFLDGKSIGSRRFNQDKLVSPLGKPVYASDPWYEPFPGEISRIQWLKDEVSEKFIRTIAKQKQHPKKSSPHIETVIKSRVAFRPQRNHVALKGEDIPKTYSYALMFWLKLTGITPQWSSIVHKGRRNMERLPAVFVHPGNTRIHACASPQVGNQNCVNSQPLKVNKWYHISVVVDSDGVFGYINAKPFGHHRFPGNGLPLISKTANIYVSDPWYPAVKGVVSDMKYITSGHNLVNKQFLEAVYNQKMHPK